MQNYMAPNFGQSYGFQMPPMPNPYLQRMENLQQFQQVINTPQQMAPIGKIVENMDVVRTIDIPIDGNAYYFPKADGSEIYMKRWLQNGTTEMIAYKPVLGEKQADTTNVPSIAKNAEYEAIMGILDGIKNDISVLAEKVNGRKAKVSADE